MQCCSFLRDEVLPWLGSNPSALPWLAVCEHLWEAWSWWNNWRRCSGESESMNTCTCASERFVFNMALDLDNFTPLQLALRGVFCAKSKTTWGERRRPPPLSVFGFDMRNPGLSSCLSQLPVSAAANSRRVLWGFGFQGSAGIGWGSGCLFFFVV